MAIIDKPTDYFNTKLFVGNSSTNAITGVGHQPDWTWIKRRDGGNGYSNFVFDAVRGVNKGISTNLTAAEITFNNGFNSFNSDGFTLGANTSNPSATEINASGGNYASWNWKAGTSFTNDASGTGIGTIDSAGSVNQDAGFSIVSYTGTGSNGTIKHGLNSAPSTIIHKRLNSTSGWVVWHKSIGTNILELNSTGAQQSGSSYINGTIPTSSVFSIGTSGDINASGGTYIAYCFAEKQSYSKFGSYTGNNNADGAFIYTGFSPAFIIIKKTSASGNGWQLRDNKRTPYGNETKNLMYASANSAEQTTDGFDFLSNGFKWRNQAGDCNGNGSYIFIAFAVNPFVTSTDNGSIPTTAR